jgi:beta-galactosidase
VVNRGAAGRRIEVVHRVLEEAGHEVAVLRTTVEVPGEARARFDQTSEVLRGIRLWSPDEPHLYRLRTEVIDAGRVIDRVDNPLGFRRIAVDPRRGLSLNGRPLRLIGTNRHQDRAGYANALPDWAHAEDVRIVKDDGFNFLRLAHYPQDPVVMRETDRLGVGVWEEIPVVNLISTSDAFAAHSERMLVEMIRQHYNHPSVLMWGYMNEVMLVKPNPMPPGYYAQVVALARRLEARAKAEDATRPTVTAISFEEIDNGTGFQDIPDILGLNLYFGWYYRDLAGFGAYVDSLHRRHPERPLIISEYGADSDERIHALAPRAFDFSTEHQQRFHESHLPQLLARPYLVGSAVWNQFDFGVKGRHDSKPNVNQKGLYYLDRTPKDVAWLYRAALRAPPVVHIASRDWRERAGSRPEDRAQPVTVYSNLDAIELFVGGRSLGRQPVRDYVARWMVPFTHGDNALRARGARGGQVAEDAMTVRYTDRSTFFSDPASAVRTFAVNAGSHYQYVDAGGRVWEADREYERGAWGSEGGKGGGAPRLVHHRIFGTVDDALFQAARDSVRGYRFDVPDGGYEVRLVLTEIVHERAGARVFSAWVNDTPLFTDLDLAGTYGRYSAVERAVRVDASGGRGIVVRFEARAGAPIVSGILLHRL